MVRFLFQNIQILLRILTLLIKQLIVEQEQASFLVNMIDILLIFLLKLLLILQDMVPSTNSLIIVIIHNTIKTINMSKIFQYFLWSQQFARLIKISDLLQINSSSNIWNVTFNKKNGSKQNLNQIANIALILQKYFRE